MKIVPRNYLFDDAFDDFLGPEKPHHNPMKCDIYEKEGVYNIEVDVPGYNKDEIEVEAKDGYVTITAEKKFEKENHEGKKYYYHERKYGKAERSFYIGDMDEEKITAKLENGTLFVKIPRIEEKDTKKIIEIE
jgi:HSP20 family molecular chaperone IbpA